MQENVGLLIAIRTSDGLTGYGYAVQGLHVSEPIEGMRQVVTELFAPILIGSSAFDSEPIGRRLERVLPRFTRTKAAIDVALFDLVGKALGQPIHRLLGGSFRRSVPVLRILPIKAPLEMARTAEALVRDGYRYLKIKVGLDAKLDIERVAQIRQAVGPSATLMVDANQAWSPVDALRAIPMMQEHGVVLFEQPIMASDLAGLAALRRATSATIEADESAMSHAEILELIRRDCVSAVNLKLGKFGGFRGTLAAAAMCRAANLSTRYGFTGASRFNAAADLHAIAATPDLGFACEVAEFARMDVDPGEGIEVVDGEIAVPQGPGLGVEPVTAAASRA
jgi:L-alanine-DL-glutamate epimerase-like enolase superfamily enzyme